MKSILILQGPNLNLVGVREPSIYGTESLTEWLEFRKAEWNSLGLEIEVAQSNHEGVLIDLLQEHGFSKHGIVFNPGGYTHTSVAIRDAIAAISSPVIEVHLSNIHAREPFRQVSLMSGVCKAVVGGLGFEGYEAAIRYLLHH